VKWLVNVHEMDVLIVAKKVTCHGNALRRVVEVGAVVVVVEGGEGLVQQELTWVEHILCRTSDIVVKKSGLNYFIMVFCLKFFCKISM